jgi:bis(5'-nucleosyl)-tetraphosphatase (symmetrical)
MLQPRHFFVGDIQGCLDELQVLLDKIAFDPATDKLWLTGDLVARGPKSLETLRFVKSLGNSATTVLGNHDLHLIATHFGIKRPKPNDRLDALLCAPDVDELIHWLTQQPMLQVVNDNVVMTHAGISPQWDIPMAIKLAKEVETILQGDRCLDYLTNMYQNTPARWEDDLSGFERFRYIVNCFTRMRFCLPDGSLEFDTKVDPKTLKDTDLVPWYTFRSAATCPHKMVFGHWASLMGKTDNDNILALDTGCVWGNHLTIWELSKNNYHTTPAIPKNAL